jgi:hypothetical protein
MSERDFIEQHIGLIEWLDSEMPNFVYGILRAELVARVSFMLTQQKRESFL